MKLFVSLLLLVLLCPVLGETAVTQASRTDESATPSVSSAPRITEYTLPPDKLAKSKALYDLGGKLRIIGTAWGLVVLWGLLHFGAAGAYRNAAERLSRARFVQAIVFAFLLLLTITLLDLPLSAYSHSVGRAYGLSVQGWGSWFGDQGKGFVVGLIIFTIAIWGITKLIGKSPRRWWFYTWLCAVPFVIFLVFIFPLVVDPLFNKFEPLEKTNPQLVDALERVTQRGGVTIPRDRMFLMKASEKVTTLNAYVTGFGPSKRVVVWDTTIKKATTPEILYIFGHEMGHYVLHHILIGIASTAVGLFIGFSVLYRIAKWALARFGQAWHLHDLSDWAAIPMLLLIFSILTSISEGVGSTISRQLEHNADVYGLEVTHDINPDPQQTAARAFQILGELSLSYPYPSKFVVFWYYDHPSIPDRIKFVTQYDPWSKGQSPKYAK
jgi:Zn-dependent protease with chaperone function